MPGLTLNFMGHDVSATSTLHRIEGEAQGASSRIGGSFKKMAGLIAGAFAGGAVGGFLKDSLAEATESQKVGAQTTAVLKSTGGAAQITAGQIGNLATAISNKAGIDDEAIQSGENLLLTFTNIKNEAGAGNDIFSQTTKIMTDMSVATGTDMKSSAIQLGKALNDPVKGISALQRVGVSFTQGQKDQIAAMVKSGDTMGAQKLILGELNKEFGGSAAAQATPAEKAAVAWGNLKEQIGTYLLPVVAKLANFLTQQVIPAVSAMVGWVSRNAAAIKTVGLYLVPIVAAWAAYAAITKVVAIAQAALNLVMEANPIILIITAIVALVAALVLAYQHSATFRNIVQSAFAVVAAAGRFLWNDVLKPIFAMWRIEFNLVRTVVVAVASAIATAWGWISRGLSAVWAVISAIYGYIKAGVRAVAAVVSAIAAAIGLAWALIARGLRLQWAVVSAIYGYIKAGVRAVASVVSAVAGAIGSAWGAISRGLRSAWTGVSTVFGWIKSGVRAVRDVVGSVASTIGGMWGRITGPLRAAWGVISGIFGGIKSGIASVASAVSSAVSSINSALDSIKGKTINSGVRNIGGSPLGSPPGHAQGTGYWTGGRTVVGEFGPEILDLPAGSAITSATSSASQSGGSAGAGAVHVHVHVAGQVYGSTEDLGRAVVGALETVAGRGMVMNIARAVR